MRLLQQLQRNELPAGSYDDCPYRRGLPSLVDRDSPVSLCEPTQSTTYLLGLSSVTDSTISLTDSNLGGSQAGRIVQFLRKRAMSKHEFDV